MAVTARRRATFDRADLRYPALSAAPGAPHRARADLRHVSAGRGGHRHRPRASRPRRALGRQQARSLALRSPRLRARPVGRLATGGSPDRSPRPRSIVASFFQSLPHRRLRRDAPLLEHRRPPHRNHPHPTTRSFPIRLPRPRASAPLTPSTSSLRSNRSRDDVGPTGAPHAHLVRRKELS